jgi:hypothetical protein
MFFVCKCRSEMSAVDVMGQYLQVAMIGAVRILLTTRSRGCLKPPGERSWSNFFQEMYGPVSDILVIDGHLLLVPYSWLV